MEEENKKNGWKIAKKILPIIGIALFIYIIFKIGIGDIIKSFSEAQYIYFIPAILFVFILVYFQTIKWQTILKIQKINFGFLWSLKVHLISMFYGLITPARIGSFIKIGYLQDKTGEFGKSSSSVIIDRLFDILAVLALAVIGSIIVGQYFSNIFMYSLILFFIFIFLFLFFMNKKRSGFILRFIYKFLIPKKMKEKAKQTFENFYESLPKKRQLIWPFILNILTWLSIYTHIYFIALALNIEIPYIYFIFILPLSTIISEIPITISGLGTREAFLIAIFGLFGGGAAAIFSMSIISLIISTAIPSFFGFLISLKKEIK